jgi:hypothetical protein
MRIVDALLRQFRATRRNDPVFGAMLYMGDRLKYWECKIVFTPTSSVIEAFVDGSVEDSMEDQHKFFEQLLQDWPNLRETIGRMLLEKWHELQPKARTERPWELFKLSSLTIPSSSIEDAKWEVSFSTLSDPHLWTVEMVGRQPQEVSVE